MAFGTAPRYATLDDLRDYLSPNPNDVDQFGTAQDGLLTDCLLRAESYIDQYTRRTFVAAAGTGYYSRYENDRVRDQALYLDKDLLALESLTNGDGQSIPLGSVWLEPRNEGPPYRIIRLKSSYVWTWNTDSDVIVAGTWGYSARAPEDIRQAAVRTAAYLYRQRAVGVTDTAGFQEGGEAQYTAGLPQDVRWMLSPYRSRTGGAW